MYTCFNTQVRDTVTCSLLPETLNIILNWPFVCGIIFWWFTCNLSLVLLPSIVLYSKQHFSETLMHLKIKCISNCYSYHPTFLFLILCFFKTFLSFILYFYQVYISYLFTTFLSQKLNYTVYSSLSLTSLT